MATVLLNVPSVVIIQATDVTVDSAGLQTLQNQVATMQAYVVQSRHAVDILAPQVEYATAIIAAIKAATGL